MIWEKPALIILSDLIEKGARRRAYDSKAIKEATWRLDDYEQDKLH